MRFLPGKPRQRVPRALQALRKMEARDFSPIDEVLAIFNELRKDDPRFCAMLATKLMEFCYPKPRSEDFEEIDNPKDVGPSEEQVRKLWNMQQTAKEFKDESLPDSKGEAGTPKQIQE